jgi:hypothetical protein
MDWNRYLYGILAWSHTSKCKSFNMQGNHFMTYAKNGFLYANCSICYNNCRLLPGFQMGLITIESPVVFWITTVLIIVTIMLIQRLGILLPTNIRVYYELSKKDPNMTKIQRLMRRYVKLVATQAILQFVIIFIMANFATEFF